MFEESYSPLARGALKFFPGLWDLDVIFQEYDPASRRCVEERGFIVNVEISSFDKFDKQ